MAGWIKSRKQQDGSFVIVITREVAGTDGTTALIEDFITRASPLEFANAILRAHGVEPAHVFAAASLAPHPNTLPDPTYVHHATIAPMPPHELAIAETEEALREALIDRMERDDDGAPGEPPRCKTGACE